MIVSVNPYKKLAIYGEDLIPQYRSQPKEDLPPHLFALAQKAFENIVTHHESQVPPRPPLPLPPPLTPLSPW